MYLFGASGHAKVIIEILELQDKEVQGLFDDNPAIKNLLNYPVLPFNEHLLKSSQLIISIGDNNTRQRVVQKFNAQYGIAIHPTATISRRSSIGEGTVVMANAVINSSTQIGKHCIINTSASIDHDCIIEDYCHISPNTTITGNVTIGEGSWIGAGAVIIPGIKIGKWCVVGAGSVVIRDVPDGKKIVGNLGRMLNQ